MFSFFNPKAVRTMTALLLLMSIVLAGGCITVTVDNGPTSALFESEPYYEPTQDTLTYPDMQMPAVSTTVPPVVTTPTSVPAVQATETDNTEAETPEEVIIDWDNLTSQKSDPNVLTKEELEKMVEQNPQMADIMELIGPYVDIFGFAYDAEQDIFYSTKYPIQRIFGYNTLYDSGASPFGMYFLTHRIRFEHEGKEWMVQLWKGQYGVTVGGEVGIYYREAGNFVRHFEAIADEDLVMMGFQLCKNDKPYLERGPEKHWWLTGFRILDVAVPTQLSMVIYFDWETPFMANSFEKGLRSVAMSDIQYKRDGTEFWLTWTL